VGTLILQGRTLYAGGDFGVAAFETVSGRQLWWVSTDNGQVGDLALVNGVLYVAGAFERIKGVARDGVAALDPLTGKPTNWQVRLSWKPGLPVGVDALGAGNGAIYLGGVFTHVFGVKRVRLAAVSPRNGRPIRWAPQPGSQPDDIYAILVTHGQVLVGGNGFAVYNARTGRSVPWRNRLLGAVLAFAFSGDTVYLGGDPDNGFDRAGGKPVNNLAAVSLPGGEFTSWRPNVARCTDVFTMAASGGKVLVAGVFSESPDC
jgi:hypothetical protein